MEVYISTDEDNQTTKTQVVPFVYPDVCTSSSPTCCGTLQYSLIDATSHENYLVILSPSTVYLNSTDQNSIGKHEVSLSITLVDYITAIAYLASFTVEVKECVVSTLTANDEISDVSFVIG